jgi:hypothetical protein
MNWEAIGAVVEIAGAFGVIATLIFLGVQIRQSSMATMAATFDAILAEWRQLERSSFIEHPENIRVFADGLKDYTSLELNDQRLFNYIMNQYALFIENMIQQHRHNNIQYSQLAPWVNYFSMLIRSQGGNIWCLQYKKILSRTLTETMDEHLVKNSTRPNIIDLVPYFFGIEQDPTKDDDI